LIHLFRFVEHCCEFVVRNNIHNNSQQIEQWSLTSRQPVKYRTRRHWFNFLFCSSLVQCICDLCFSAREVALLPRCSSVCPSFRLSVWDGHALWSYCAF